MAEKKENFVGKVTHLYHKIGVAIVKLSGSVAVGDILHFKRNGREFEEKVSSMQINHQDVSSATKGDEAGIKVSGQTREGDKVYKK